MLISLLESEIADDALWNSFHAEAGSDCVEGTQKGNLSQIQDWINAPEVIFWLGGSGGTGGSTIPRTVTQQFEKGGLLGKLLRTQVLQNQS